MRDSDTLDDAAERVHEIHEMIVNAFKMIEDILGLLPTDEENDELLDRAETIAVRRFVDTLKKEMTAADLGFDALIKECQPRQIVRELDKCDDCAQCSCCEREDIDCWIGNNTSYSSKAAMLAALERLE
jgi:hypothetical protein